MNNLRILYSSNAIWATSGYGVQGKSLLPRLADLASVGGRQNIAQFAWYGLQGGIHEWEGFKIYPCGVDPYGNDIIQSHTRHFGANVVISLIDAWVMQQVGQKVKPALWLPWLPIDHDPVPQKVVDAISDAYLPLTYSKWGSEMLNKLGIQNYYIPHGIETNVFKVLDPEVVQDFKQQYLKHDGHLTIMVAANKGYPDRKNFQGQLAAWANFAKNKPDAKLYIHTEPTPLYQGLNLPQLCQHLGIADKVMFPERYEYFIGLPAEYLAYIYNSANVLMAAAMSEGFGIPIIEAQACGTPVITTNFSAMPELVRYGDIIDVERMVWTPLEAYQAVPNQDQITEALEENYQLWLDSDKQKDLNAGMKASQAIQMEYNWDSLVNTHWKPLFENLHTKIFNTPKPVIQPSVNTTKSGKIIP